MNDNLLKIALEILKDEASGDTKAAAEKMHLDDYSMTWMYRSKSDLFPSVSGDVVRESMSDVYTIKGRVYEIINHAQGDDVVFIEMIESYPDEKSGKEFRTPITLVLKFKDGKIITGRHYTDPQLSYEYLSKETIYSALKQRPMFSIDMNGTRDS
jgi:hypothetical protein